MPILAATNRRVLRDVLAWGILFGTLYFIQGTNETAAGLVTQPVNSLLKGWGNSAAQITTFVAVLEMPWCLKPLFGLLTDFVPLARYRRKSYLMAAGLLTSLCFLSIYYLLRLAPGIQSFLLLGLFASTMAVTLGDVVLDALIIEAGQPRGITGRLQSVRWGASYLATIVTGSLGGKLCEERQEASAFLICGGLALAAFVLSLVAVREPAEAIRDEDWRTIRKSIGASLRSPTVIAVGAFLFAWHFNPFTPSVLYLHMTKTMRLSEEFYGQTISLVAIGSLAACIVYGVYCRRISMRILVPMAVIGGAVSTLAYGLMVDRMSAAIVSLLVGFTYMTANMVQCDLAARACPLHAAGTMFSIFMAACNLSTLLSTWLGGYLYQ
jgi:predicted MFS family arabinose efflux permease